MEDKENVVVPALEDDSIRSRILTIRGVQVMVDRDLAELYGVRTKVLNQAVKRNIERFPERFMFQLKKTDLEDWKSQFAASNDQLTKGTLFLTGHDSSLRSQFVTLNKRQGQHLKYMPYAFTEQGIAMLSAVLKSATAVSVSIKIMDAFIAMRKTLASLAPLLSRIEETERRQLKQENAQVHNEERFKLILIQPPRQEVLCLLVDGQVQHPGHPCENLITPSCNPTRVLLNYPPSRHQERCAEAHPPTEWNTTVVAERRCARKGNMFQKAARLDRRMGGQSIAGSIPD